MTTAIAVEGLSKRYKLGEGERQSYATLRDTVAEMAGRSWSRVSRAASRTKAAKPDRTRDLWALRDVGFEVRAGEAVGIVGRNGAGKSTLMKVLSRITTPTHGRIQIRGRLGSLLEVGTGFHPELTGRENIMLNGAIMGMNRREILRKFGAIVEFAELERFIDTPVKRYSSGMYVRLAFAVAAHMEPDILLIDEVLSVGDVAFQRKCMDHTKRLLQRNATIMVVSHNMFAVRSMCDRSIYLDQGRITHDGPTEDIVRIYDREGRLDMLPWASAEVGSDPRKCPIYIKELELTDAQGSPCTLFRLGDQMRLRLHFEVTEPVRSPNFGIGIVRSDGVACCHYNTHLGGFPTGTIERAGVLELLTPPIKLISDIYNILILIRDSRTDRLLCAQTAKTFHVRHPVLSNEYGVFHEEGQWAWVDDANASTPHEATEGALA